LHSLSALLSADRSAEKTQELVLRALARSEEFGEARPILNALVRELGLFPYLDPEELPELDQLAYEYHRVEELEDLVFHGPQAEVYRRLMSGESIMLSAPTSFGKSLVIDAVIASRRFRNVVIVVPTIALIDETRRRLMQRFRKSYKVITHPSQRRATRNVFVYTPERILEEHALGDVDFFVVDEFYKLNPNQQRFDIGRCIRLNQAFHRLVKTGTPFYLLGPNIRDVHHGAVARLRATLMVLNYHTVVSELHNVRPARGKELDELAALCKRLTEPTIIFCKSPQGASKVARFLIDKGVGFDSEVNTEAANWIAKNYHPDWHFGVGLRHGIGVHHGRIPRALAQFVVRLFDQGMLRFLVCTSTLIEGVNTKAKNVIVFDDKINRAQIDLFTFNNIRGRSGRMGQHLIGNVYVFHEPPTDELPFLDIPAVTQSPDAPESLLLQLDEVELTAGSRSRLQPIFNQDHLSVSTLRENPAVDPWQQIAFARLLGLDPDRHHRTLGWRGWPTSEQLMATIEVMFATFDGKRLAGGSVSNARQLKVLLDQLRRHPSTRDLIEDRQRYRDDPDASVQKVLDFLRLWAQFNFPRLLRAMNKIQKEVFERHALRPGDYTPFAGAVENFFLDPGVAALDEYGVPIEIARKIAPLVEAGGDLDATLDRLRNVADSAIKSLDPFERSFVVYARETV
jgi:hypothetical protein